MQNFRHARIVPISRAFGFVVDGHWVTGGKNDERVRSKVVGVIPGYCGETGGQLEFALLPDFIKERTITLCDPLSKRPQFVLDAPKENPGECIEMLRLYRAAFVGGNRPTQEELFSDLLERKPLLNFSTPYTNQKILASLSVDSSCELVVLPKRKPVAPKPKPKLVYTPLGFRFK